MKLFIFVFLFSISIGSFAQSGIYNTAFRSAITSKNEKDIIYYLNKGADINCLDQNGWAALHECVWDNRSEIVKLLLLSGANINVRSKEGITPLMCSAHRGNLRECYILYKNGADVRLKDLTGKSAEDWARNAGYLRVTQFILNPETYSEMPTFDEYDLTVSNSKNIQEAITLAEKALTAIICELDSNKNSNFQERKTLLNFTLANLYFENIDYIKAKPLYLAVLNDKKEFSRENHLDSLEIRNCLGIIYQSIGLFSKAEQLYLNSLELARDLYGEYKLEGAYVLNNLAQLYLELGDYRKAEYFCLESIKVKKINFGESDIKYASSISMLGQIYLSQGNFNLAEIQLLEALRIAKKGNDNILYSRCLYNLSELYNELGSYRKSESLKIESLSYLKSVKSKFTNDYLCGIIGLASVYRSLIEPLKAELLYIESIDLIKSSSQNFNTLKVSTLNGLGNLYFQNEEYNKAEPLYLEAVNLSRSFLGVSHRSYATSMNNLSALYKNTNNFSKAESIILESVKIIESSVGKCCPEYAQTIGNLAGLYMNMTEYSKSEPYFIESDAIYKSIIKNNFSFLSDNDRKYYWQINEYRLIDLHPSFAYSYHPQKPSISTFAYDNTLFTKGLLLNTSLQIQNAILQSGDSILINTWENQRDLKRQINLLQAKPLAQQGDLKIMEAQADSLDKVLTQKSQLYKQSTTDMQVKWTDVQKSLKTDEAAIEFISFNYFNKHYTDSTMYCALVLKKNSKYPEMIPLFEEKQLDSLFVNSNNRDDTENIILEQYRGISNSRKDSIVDRKLYYGKKMYSLLWKPLEGSLKNMKTVYYAPSGKLNQVAFAAIPIDSSYLLSDKYKLHQVTSTRQVLKNNSAAAKVQEAALFGGISYELEEKEAAKVQLAQNRSMLPAFVSDSTQRSNTFGYLKGTAEEVTGIAETFSKKGLNDLLFTGTIASEAAFKKLNGTPTDIIHIATHGFYLPVEESKRQDMHFMGMDNERRNVVVKNPLLRSGLAFAGANRAWRGDSIPDNWEDGILTSHEISQINLTHTDLVVLSACETALGDIKGSEGVFGLQRAFKMAGVQTLIMSLWKVPDAQTSQLMQGFYKYWLGGMSKHDAFTKAQNEVRKANPNPYYWAAFVMVD